VTEPDASAENAERPDEAAMDEARTSGRSADLPVYGPADIDDEL